MKQDLFDCLAVTRAMQSLVDAPELKSQFRRMLENYVRSYPGERLTLLDADLEEAARKADHVMHELYATLGDQNDPEQLSLQISIFKWLTDALVAEANARKSLLRRILGGTMFNYEKHPLPRRVEKCSQNLALAAMKILMKQHAALDRLLSRR